MIINKTVFTLGFSESLHELKNKIEGNAAVWEYFVYITEGKRLKIGMLSELKSEAHSPVIVGVASCKAFACSIVVHIIKKSLLRGETVEQGIIRLLDA